MQVSVAEAHNCLSQLLKEIRTRTVTITRRGEPIAVLMSSDEYEQIKRAKAYLEMLRLAQLFRGRDLSARELHEASRTELEERP